MYLHQQHTRLLQVFPLALRYVLLVCSVSISSVAIIITRYVHAAVSFTRPSHPTTVRSFGRPLIPLLTTNIVDSTIHRPFDSVRRRRLPRFLLTPNVL